MPAPINAAVISFSYLMTTLQSWGSGEAAPTEVTLGVDARVPHLGAAILGVKKPSDRAEEQSVPDTASEPPPQYDSVVPSASLDANDTLIPDFFGSHQELYVNRDSKLCVRHWLVMQLTWQEVHLVAFVPLGNFNASGRAHRLVHREQPVGGRYVPRECAPVYRRPL